jgi:hypothetical protein
MLLIDRMLVGGIKFVLTKIAAAVDEELNDEGRLHEELLAAEMRLELGEISKVNFDQLEAALLRRIRELREARGEDAGISTDMKVTGIEASFGGDEADR